MFTGEEFWAENSTVAMDVCFPGVGGAVSELQYCGYPFNISVPTPEPTSGPTSGPTAGPTAGPTSQPTYSPTSPPTFYTYPPTSPPTVYTYPPTAPPTQPTESPTQPTESPTQPTESPTQCSINNCTFSTLAVGVPLTDLAQVAALKIECLMSVSITNTSDNNVGNIFNSSDVQGTTDNDDPDLGSPNVKCPNSGPGRGNGGKPRAPFPNCEPLGNLLIIQNEDFEPAIPNDSPYGGCFVFEFVRPVNLLDFGIVDVDEDETATISTTSKTGAVSSLESPAEGVGDNGHWKAASTNDLSAFVNIVTMEICIPGSGAISFINVDPCDT